MYTTIIEYTSRIVKNKSSIPSNVEAVYLNTQYRRGIIEEVSILNKDTVILELVTNRIHPYKCDLQLEFKLFSFPNGFYIPNAKVTKIVPSSQNLVDIVLSCELQNIDGSKINCSSCITSVITSDNKTSSELQKINNLAVGSYVNLVCLNQLNCTANKRLVLMANIATKIKPILFVATNIDISLFKFHENKKIAAAISEFAGNGEADELVNKQSYYMTPLGFYNAEDGTEFFSEGEHYAGYKSLNEFLLAVSNNWYFVIHNNSLLQSGDLDTLAKFYEF